MQISMCNFTGEAFVMVKWYCAFMGGEREVIMSLAFFTYIGKLWTVKELLNKFFSSLKFLKYKYTYYKLYLMYIIIISDHNSGYKHVLFNRIKEKKTKKNLVDFYYLTEGLRWWGYQHIFFNATRFPRGWPATLEYCYHR